MKTAVGVPAGPSKEEEERTKEEKLKALMEEIKKKPLPDMAIDEGMMRTLRDALHSEKVEWKDAKSPP
jgi:hypothetical protein